jgi:nitrile hydratase accessory protein
MFTHFEDYAACSQLGQPDSPPRSQGRLQFTSNWQRQLHGLALAVSKEGHFEWEDFRQHLIASIGEWERGDCVGQPAWDYYERYLDALTRVLADRGLVASGDMELIVDRIRTT